MDPGPLRRALADALAFVLPVACAGCETPDVALCERCRAALVPRPRTRRLDGVRVVSGLVWDGPVVGVVRALKEDGRTGLARELAPALRAAAAGAGDAIVVPVPTSGAALRRRGYRVPDLLARRAGLPPRRLLTLARRTADQRLLGREDRAANVRDSLRAHGVAGASILVVDDVVTTGATLREAFRALRAEGAEVVAAITVASAERHRPHLSDTGQTAT